MMSLRSRGLSPNLGKPSASTSHSGEDYGLIIHQSICCYQVSLLNTDWYCLVMIFLLLAGAMKPHSYRGAPYLDSQGHGS